MKESNKKKSSAVKDETSVILSILIVNYNGREFLEKCLLSLRNRLSISNEIIMVDNASEDGSVEYVKKQFPFVTVLESVENLGFAGGNNLASNYARGEILLLLNNDTYIVDDIAPAVRQFKKDTRLGCLGCKIRYADGRLQHSFGYDHTPLRIVMSWLKPKCYNMWPSVFYREELDDSAYENCQNDISWVSGAFLMTRKIVWQKLNGFDARYFMYMEDVDYCRRLRALGYRVEYFPSVEIVHYEGAGKSWVGVMALKRTMRSYVIYTTKFYGGLAAWFVRLGMSVVLLSRSGTYWLQSMLQDSSDLKEKRVGYLVAIASLYQFK